MGFALTEVREQGPDEGRDGGLRGFDGGGVAEVPEGFAGDGADGGQRDVRGKG